VLCRAVSCCALLCSYPSFKIQDPAEKARARQDLLAGALGDKLKLLSKLVVSLCLLIQGWQSMRLCRRRGGESVGTHRGGESVWTQGLWAL
jgi:hypothetical protein